MSPLPRQGLPAACAFEMPYPTTALAAASGAALSGEAGREAHLADTPSPPPSEAAGLAPSVPSGAAGTVPGTVAPGAVRARRFRRRAQHEADELTVRNVTLFFAGSLDVCCTGKVLGVRRRAHI